MATDGGADRNSGLEGASSWAAAFSVKHGDETCDAEVTAYGGVINGAGHGPILAEISAMLFAFAVAAALVVIQVVFIADNTYVCDTTNLILANAMQQPPPKLCPASAGMSDGARVTARKQSGHRATPTSGRGRGGEP